MVGDEVNLTKNDDGERHNRTAVSNQIEYKGKETQSTDHVSRAVCGEENDNGV